MRQLILMRHAHAEAERSAASDAERLLDPRGRLEAAEAAQRLRAHGLVPDAIVTSPAARARETALIVAEQLGLAENHLHCEPELYLASPATLLAVIRRNTPQINRLLLVGHNPGLSELAEQFNAQWHSGLRTAGICCVSLKNQPWERLVARPVRCKVLS